MSTLVVPDDPIAQPNGSRLSEDVAEKKIGVSVCIPALNEEGIIAETVAEATEVLSAMPGEHEILVVDDGSCDRTWEILQQAVKQFPMLGTLRHPQRRGLPQAQKTLIEAASGKYIFHIGADREWKMSEIPRMLELLENGNDIVIGIRRRKQYSLWRKFVSLMYNALVALFWGRHFGDLGSIKMARSALWKLIPIETDSAFVNAERILIGYANGAQVATIPVDHVARKTGKSSFSGVKQAVRAFRDLLSFRLSPRSWQRLPDGWQLSTTEAFPVPSLQERTGVS
ncbi:MAG: glycosyltransferase family 2 protein [Gemmataceae bacterium]